MPKYEWKERGIRCQCGRNGEWLASLQYRAGGWEFADITGDPIDDDDRAEVCRKLAELRKRDGGSETIEGE